VRAKAAQRSAIFRRVVSLNGRVIPLDYITFALDGMSEGMIRKSVKRFSLATNALRLRGDHAQTIS